VAGTIDTDPKALSQMASELKRANETVDGCIKRVRSVLNATRWNDNVRRDFEEKLETIANLAKQMVRASEESQTILRDKLKVLDEYTGGSA
jgi:uncharacterized protein YukE